MKRNLSIIEEVGPRRAAQDGAALKTVQGVWQLPDPARHGESMAPAAQEHAFPDPCRADHTTHATACHLSAAAAEFSGGVSGAPFLEQRVSPLCRVHTDLVQK